MPEPTIPFQYTIEFKNGRLESFSIDLDPDTLALIPQPRSVYPDWVRYEVFKCENCTLNDPPVRCPLAANLLGVAEHFFKDISYEEVNVTVQTPARNYQKKVALQDALRSIFGIYMVTSNCPIFDKLRPLVFMHLPFATVQETSYRALSMYVLGQFFIQRKGGDPDWSLKKLGKIYQEIEIVNRALHQRFVKAGFHDACLNAIGNLNCYAQFTQMFLEPGSLDKIEKIFSACTAQEKSVDGNTSLTP